MRLPMAFTISGCSGAGKVQVKFNANTEYEMINNYKILQNAFNKAGIEKVCFRTGLVCVSFYLASC